MKKIHADFTKLLNKNINVISDQLKKSYTSKVTNIKQIAENELNDMKNQHLHVKDSLSHH